MRALIAILCLAALSCGEPNVEQTLLSAQTSQTGTLDSQTGVSALQIDPCALVAKQDMAVMFGELKEGPSPSTGLRNERQCNFMNMAGSWIKLSLYGGQERWEWEKGITNAQNPRDVGGLGDEAFAIKRGTDSVIYVRKGESILELSCSCSSENAEAIARVATTKL